MADKLISKIPEGPLSEKWTKHKTQLRVVNPGNKRKIEIIVIGTGLGGASAAASLGELGYNVKVFCISDSPRRAHSIAAQGGINAAKNYQNDNDSVYRLFYETLREVSTLQRTIRMTTIPFTDFSMRPSRVVTIAAVRQMYIVLLK